MCGVGLAARDACDVDCLVGGVPREGDACGAVLLIASDLRWWAEGVGVAGSCYLAAGSVERSALRR